jgi:hypothetical protein
MIDKSFILKYLPFSLLLITINSHGQTLQLGSTTFWWIVQFIVLFFFWIIKKNYTTNIHTKNLFVLDLYIYYVIVQIIRATFIAESYWDWKGLLSSSMSLLIPIVAYASNSKFLLKHLINYYIYFTAPLFLLIQFYIGKDEFGFYLAPFSFLLLFIPVLTIKWKIILLGIALYVIFADFGARSNLIKFSLPILLSFLYYFKNIISNKLLEFFRLILIGLPIVFLLLAIFGNFNLFNSQGDNHKGVLVTKRDYKGNLVEDDLTADTRTTLYVDVLNTAKKYNFWIFGRSPVLGYLSEAFGDNDLNGRGERLGNEVAILNYFTWLGFVGVLFIFFIFYKASYLAVNNSNNIFSKIIGLFIAFRWSYAWVEDTNIFYIQYIYLWFFIGFCFSINFRNMSDNEIIKWVREIFVKKNHFNSNRFKIQLPKLNSN